MTLPHRKPIALLIAIILIGIMIASGCHSKHIVPHPVATSAPPPPRPTDGAIRPTGLALTFAPSAEPTGFGLYSYLLLGAKPSEATRPLYVAIVKASLNKTSEIGTQLRYFKPAQLNYYIIPVFEGSPAGGSNEATANWIVDNYDYPRAAKILSTLSGSHSGLYILSVLAKPLDLSKPLAPPYFLLDLTHFDPEMATAAIQYFLDQASKDEPWEENVGQRMALDVRNYIEKMGNQMHFVGPALTTAIQWLQPPKAQESPTANR